MQNLKLKIGNDYYQVQGEPFKVTGESQIFKYGTSRLLKIYHDPDSCRSQKLRASLQERLYAGLEGFAAVPRELAFDSSGGKEEVAGFTMDFFEGHELFSNLAEETFRKQNSLGIRAVAHAFCELHGQLSSVHRSGFRVGDLNALNLLVKFSGKNVSVKMVDADSWGFVGNAQIPAWKVSAIMAAIEHPKLSMANTSGQAKENGEYYQTLLERDWFAFALHLASALTLLDPFRAGIPQHGDVLDSEERKKKGLHIWHANIRLPRDKQVSCLRLGPKMVFLLKNWLDINARGPFPLDFLAGEFVAGLTRCAQCNLEVHKSCGRCPQCFTRL